MTKQTYIKQGGVWQPVKSVWMRIGGVWKKDVMPHVKISGIHKECMQYIIMLESVSHPANMFAENGTNLNNLNLPSTLRLNLSNGTYEDVPVTWNNDDNYNSVVHGDYQFTAIYDLPEGVTGTKPVITLVVTVFEYDLVVAIPWTNSVSAFAVSSARDIIWTFNHGLGGLGCYASKSSDREVAFIGSRGAASSYQDVRILNKSGQDIFSVSRGGWTWRDVCFIDNERNIIAAGTYSSNYGGHSIIKWPRYWQASWYATHGTETAGISPDTNNNLFTAGLASDLKSIAYFDGSDGSLIWSGDHGGDVRGVHTNSISYLTGGNRVSNLTTRKYNASGSLQWSRDHGASVYDCVADSTNSHNVATGTRTSNVTTRKYSGTGSLNWSVDFGNLTTKVEEKDGKIYVAGYVSNNATLRIYNVTNGVLLESHNFLGVRPAGIRCF